MKKPNIILLIFFSLSLWAQENNEEKKRLEFNDYFFDAMNERLKNNYEKSNEYFEQCLALDDQNDVIYFKIAQNYLDAKKYEEALQYLEKVRALNPENKWYAKLYIDIKIDSGTPRDEVRKMIKEFEPVAKNKYLIQSLYRKMYRKTPRVTYKTKNLKPLPSTGDKLPALWQQKQYKKLIETGEKMLDEQPDNPKIYLYIAKAYLAVNKPKKALEYLEMGTDFILNDKETRKAYYLEMIKAYQSLNKPKKVKLYKQKLEKI